MAKIYEYVCGVRVKISTLQNIVLNVITTCAFLAIFGMTLFLGFCLGVGIVEVLQRIFL